MSQQLCRSRFKKPRADSKLKTLPIATQARIAELLSTQKLNAVVEKLNGEGLQTSRQSLSEFYSWYQLQNATLGTSIAEVISKMRALIDRLNKRNKETERLADKARGAMTLLRNDARSAERLLEDLKRHFGIK